MAKYKIKKTNILHDGKLYPEGSEIELTEEQAKKIADYLLPIEEKKTNTAKTTNNTTKTSSNTSKTTSKTKQNDEIKENEVTE